MNVAMIGLGTMGAPMAENLLKAGFELTVHNRTRERERRLVELGAIPASSPAEAAQRADVTLSCVSDTPDALAVLLDADRGAIAGARANSVVVDCSTIEPAAAKRLAAAFSDRQVGFVDAPVSGGSEGAAAGTLAVMCGGTRADFERALPVLNVVGSRVTHVGPPGAGQIAKAVNQVMIAGIYQAVAEGISLAHRAGAAVPNVLSAIEAGAARSWVLEHRAGNMLSDEYPLGFRLRLHRKDLAIALQTARVAGVPLPITSYVATVEDGLIGGGHGDEDVSAIARAVRRAAGIEDGPLG